jgi:hypothetical protein
MIDLLEPMSLPMPRMRAALLLRPLTLVCLASLLQIPGYAAEREPAVLGQLLEKLKSSPGSLPSVLGQYNRIEAAKDLDVFARYEIHQGLLKALREMKDPAVASAAEDRLKETTRSEFPAQVLLLKVMVAQDFPAPRAQRIGWLVSAARSKSPRLSVWGVHLLGDSRWSEAVDALIELVRTEEAERPTGLLLSLASAELYRLLGTRGAGTSAEIQKNWESMGKKLPTSPDFSPPTGGGGVTVVFFGDRVSPFSVFAIDTSSSMLEAATLRTSSRSADPAAKTKKVDIVKEELKRALSGLLPNCRFNIIAYNKTCYPWKGGQRTVRLHAATKDSIASATKFTAGLRVAQGTNIHDTMVAALAISEVETIYLLSDGIPSVGGGPAEIKKRVAAMNYLAGVRVVAYGFAAEKGGSFDEEFMKRLASENWGWYRRLN